MTNFVWKPNPCLKHFLSVKNTLCLTRSDLFKDFGRSELYTVDFFVLLRCPCASQGFLDELVISSMQLTLGRKNLSHLNYHFLVLALIQQIKAHLVSENVMFNITLTISHSI